MDFPEAKTTEIERVLAQRDRNIAWLARKVEVHPSYAWKMIRGIRPLTDDFKKAAAGVLDLDVDDLFPPEPAQAAS